MKELYFKAKAFIDMYETAFGEPEKECKEYWDLRDLLTRLEKKIFK